MICDKCDQDIDTRVCEGCGQEIRSLGPFCYLCGHELGTEKGARDEKQSSSPDQADPDSTDFSSRILCSDGTCIGVIDEHGKCKVCGKPYTPET
jgi:hypothetical protein